MEEAGFNKIDVSNTSVGKSSFVTSQPKSQMKNKKHNFFKTRKQKIIGVVVLAIILLVAYVGVNTFIFLNDAKKTYAQVKIAYDAIKQQNVVVAKDELVKTQKQLTVLQRDLLPIAFLGYIPFLGGYYNDVKNLVDASSHGINAGITATDSLIPYADVLGLKGDKSFAQGSAEDRIRLAIKTMDKVVPKIDTIEKDLIAAKKATDKVNPNRYPPIGKLKKVHDTLQDLKNIVDGSVVAVEQGKPLIKLLPDLLGANGEKKYLVLFQNDKELRPTGGFMTFYAVFRLEQGVIHVDKAGDIYTLDDSLPSHQAAPPIIAKYLPKVDTFNIRDSNLSPDFVESMKTFNKMYNTSRDKADIDGIIAIDTHFLVSILDVLGDVQAGGLTFNSKNDPRCDCPQAVFVLEDNTTKPVNYIKTNRKGLLAELLFAIIQKALSSSPKEYWGNLMQTAINDAQEKHVMFYLFNPEAQKGIDALGWSGAIKPFDGDYLHINDSNFGGAKSNLFVEQNVRVDFKIDSNGEVTKTLTISYKNPKPHSDCNLEHGELCLNATLRDFQRVYVPKGSTLISSKGSEVKTTVKQDLGKTDFESFLTVNPLGSAKIIYEYKLPFKVEGKTLPFLIQKQPGTDAVPYEIYVNGNKTDAFNLLTDREIQVPVR
ncbi:MAG: DUF4012 domain-containing protein [Candidatus Levybacteria bacterium]|nr:DUF4012 domain-containing protein [Candidatus Levybacteria bacterium]